MISPVVKPYGWRPAGLIAYLFGPGRHEEHRDPRVVASWDGAPRFHQPPPLPAVRLGAEVVQPGEFDLDLTALIGVMQEWPHRAGLPLSTPTVTAAGRVRAEEVAQWSAWLRTAGKRRPPPHAPPWVQWYRYDPAADRVVLKSGYVWHCPVRLHPDDPVLSDEQWEMIAQRLMQATGLHQAGCRWIAVRHAEDHIHLVATLVSEKTGRRVWPRNDFAQLRAECQRLERELGLTPTAGIDTTATRQASRAELGKAARTGRDEPTRVELRRLLGKLAAAASDGEVFLGLLKRHGVMVRLSRGSNGQIRGYSVGLPRDTSRGGAQVFYGGGTLATDLSWPKLLARWASAPTTADQPPRSTADPGTAGPQDRRAVLDDAKAVVDQAAAALRAGQENGDGIAHVTGDLIAALAFVREGRDPGPLGGVLDRVDRCTRTPTTVLPVEWGPVARDLRHAARRLCAVGSLSGRGREKFALAALLLAISALVAEIAAWQQDRRRLHQAAAARQVAALLPQHATTQRPTTPAPPRRPAVAPRPDALPARPLPRPDAPRPGRTAR